MPRDSKTFTEASGGTVEISPGFTGTQLTVTNDNGSQASLTMNSREFERFLEWMIGISVDTDIVEDSDDGEEMIDEEDIMGYKF